MGIYGFLFAFNVVGKIQAVYVVQFIPAEVNRFNVNQGGALFACLCNGAV